MQITEIGVTVERRLSDNNYGGEMVSVHLAASLERGDDAMDCAQALVAQARTRAEEGLNQSSNARIRSQAAPHPTYETVMRQLEPRI